MADYDRYSNNNREDRRGRNRGFDRDRFEDRRLDDRTGYGAQSSEGYRADRAYQGATDYGRDDERSSNYGGYEDRSFSSQERFGQERSGQGRSGEGRSGGGYYGSYSGGGEQRYGSDPYGYDRSDYRSGEAARGYQTNRPTGMRQNYSSEGFGGRSGGANSSARESYAFNPYEQGGVTSEFGFGQWDREDNRYLRDRDRDSDRNRGRDHDRGFFEKMGDRVASWFGDDDRRGEHSGRGPKGYKRSDDRIREDVSDRLADDSWLDASDIEVIVADMEVTLVGTVNDRDAKRRAEALAEGISGVKHVQNNLRVSQLNRGTESTTSASSTGSTTESSSTTSVAGENSTLSKQAAGRA